MKDKFISRLSIENYKSIKKLSLPTKRVNLFIGEPNAGKTNIIEALGFLAMNMQNDRTFQDVYRFTNVTDLFNDSDISHPIKVRTNLMDFTLGNNINSSGAIMGDFIGSFTKDKDSKTEIHLKFNLSYDGKFRNTEGNPTNNIMFYQFKKLKEFSGGFRNFLSPPFGENIPVLLVSSKTLKEMVSGVLKDKGLKLMIKPITNEVLIGKFMDDDTIYTYPYHSLSDTLQRIIFFQLAIETANGHVLIFDEPESNTFPFYTKQIAEKIARDKRNQYFMTTHNPYLLSSIIEKTPLKDLSVSIVYMRKHETKIKTLSPKLIKETFERDVFFDLDYFINAK